MEILEEMEYRVNKIQNASSSGMARYHANKAEELYNRYTIIKKNYNYNPLAHYWKDVFTLKEITEIPCEDEHEKRQYMQSEEHFQGLYWVGCVGFDPIKKLPIPNGKIGLASDVSKRMKNYCTHNPMVWHNDCSLKVEGDYATLCEMERTAHKFLEKVATRLCPNTAEWYEFSETIYLALCECLQNENFFYYVTQENKHQTAMKILQTKVDEKKA